MKFFANDELKPEILKRDNDWLDSLVLYHQLLRSDNKKNCKLEFTFEVHEAILVFVD